MKYLNFKAMKYLNQKGFTIVQAIFVLVVLGMLGAYMVTMSTVQQATSTQTLMQARAYQAARAGLEWGIKTVVDSDPSECFTNTDGDFSLGVFDVDVDCEKLDEGHEGDQPFKVFNLTSKATYSDLSNPDYVSRTLEVIIHD
jgi:MSHA biogenesis protein MshP